MRVDIVSSAPGRFRLHHGVVASVKSVNKSRAITRWTATAGLDRWLQLNPIDAHPTQVTVYQRADQRQCLKEADHRVRKAPVHQDGVSGACTRISE